MVAVGAVQAYALVQSTVRALYSELLPRETWEALAQAPDYDALLGMLARTPYGPYLEIDRSELTARRTVYQIRWHLADVYAKLIRISPEPAASLLRTLWHHYEVDNIKVTLRGINTGASWRHVLHLLYPMELYTAVGTDHFRRMVRAGTMQEAMEVLRETEYYPILSHALARYQEEQTPFPLEVALDLGYRRQLWASIHRLKGTDREMAMKTVGTALDTDNLLWAIRYRVYHKLSEMEIVNYTLPMGYEVEDADIRAIARGEDVLSVVLNVYPHLTEKLQGVAVDTGEGLQQLEQAFLGMLVERCRGMFVGSPFHIGLPLGYVWLNEYEIRDLTVIIEAKVSGLPPESFWPFLLLPRSR